MLRRKLLRIFLTIFFNTYIFLKLPFYTLGICYFNSDIFIIAFLDLWTQGLVFSLTIGKETVTPGAPAKMTLQIETIGLVANHMIS